MHERYRDVSIVRIEFEKERKIRKLLQRPFSRFYVFFMIRIYVKKMYKS